MTDADFLDLLRQHVADRKARREDMIATTLEPITMHPIHRSALYELGMLDDLLALHLQSQEREAGDAS